jgi:hypothetical protein
VVELGLQVAVVAVGRVGALVQQAPPLAVQEAHMAAVAAWVATLVLELVVRVLAVQSEYSGLEPYANSHQLARRMNNHA